MVQGNQDSFLWRLGFGGVMLLAAGAGWMPGSKAEAAPPVSKQLLVLYPAKTFEGGKAHFYEYKTEDGITIKYFILKSSDGVIRAAFDACDVCWRRRKRIFPKGGFHGLPKLRAAFCFRPDQRGERRLQSRHPSPER